MTTHIRSSTFNAIVLFESLRAADTRTGFALYEKHLEPRGAQDPPIYVDYHFLSGATEFLGAIGALAHFAANHDLFPILHLETHGGDDGLYCGEGEVVTWMALRAALQQLNQAVRGRLLVVVAACDGGNLIHTVDPTDRSPVMGIVGPAHQMLPSDFAKAFPVFYDTLMGTGNLDTALGALRAANDTYPDPWHYYSAEHLFGIAFGQFLAGLRTPEAQLELAESILSQARAANGTLPESIEIETRNRIRSDIANPEPYFERLMKHFSMQDLFPEQKDRFALTLAEAKYIYERNK